MLATAVILSYRRQDVLRRQLLYYANKPIHLIFADGSDDDWGSGQSGSIGEMTWEYFRISGSLTYLQRLAEAVSRVRTEYMFFLDDEECILLTGIKQAVAFLSVNFDHACAGGTAYTTSLSRRRLCLVPHYNQSNKFSLAVNDPIQRFHHLFNSKRTKACYYQVLRTADVKIFAETCGNYSLHEKSRYLPEHLLLGFLALCGKWEPGNYPFWIRNGGSQPKTDGESEKIHVQNVVEMADLIYAAFGKRKLRDERTNTDLTPNVLEKSMRSLTKAKYDNSRELRSRGFTSRFKTSAKRIFTTSLRLLGVIAHIVFDLCPSLYEVVRPHGLRSFRKFAIENDQSRSEVYNDVLFIERIWVNHPQGVSTSDFGLLMRVGF
jgi:glycosyltransferase domain-containing protein